MARAIRTRWLLVLLVAAGQSVAMVVGSIWLVNWLERSVSAIVRDRVLATAHEHAGQIAMLISSINLDSASPQTESGQRLQALIEQIRLPGGGFLSVIDPQTGQVLCHPALTTGSETSTEPEFRVVGWHDLAALDARLLVHQRETAVMSAIEPFTDQARFVAIAGSALLVAFTALLTAFIVRRYENRLGHINENLEKLIEVRSRALLKSRSAVIFGLAKLAESRDDQTGQHLERIRHYVLLLARALKGLRPEIDDDYIETLADTSSLHDIGKVGIADSVLLHPGPLDDVQRKEIQRHPTIGGDTLLALKRVWGNDPFLVTACEIAFAHHERWDGQGYPFGLAGEDIPFSARIVAVADVYDALTTARVYKPAMSHEQARMIIVNGSGTHFDPLVVRSFEQVEQQIIRAAQAMHDPPRG